MGRKRREGRKAGKKIKNSKIITKNTEKLKSDKLKRRILLENT
jgi:hypothetical protein